MKKNLIFKSFLLITACSNNIISSAAATSYKKSFLGALFLAQNEEKELPLHSAANETENLQALREITRFWPKAINKREGTCGKTALMITTINSDRKAIEFLLGKGANPNIQCHRGSTPLFVAASRNGHMNIIRQLLSHGAAIDEPFLRFEGATVLMTAVFSGDQETIECLLQRGANINAVDRHNRTVFYYADERGDQKISDFLCNRKRRPKNIRELLRHY